MDDEPSTQSRESDDPTYSVRAEISREMVRLYKHQFGRGPTRARTEFAGPDVVISILEQTFTPAERKLVQLGEDQRLRDIRTFFQHANEADFKGAVERLLNRKVHAFMSGIDTDQDVSVEVFYLEQDSH